MELFNSKKGNCMRRKELIPNRALAMVEAERCILNTVEKQRIAKSLINMGFAMVDSEHSSGNGADIGHVTYEHKDTHSTVLFSVVHGASYSHDFISYASGEHRYKTIELWNKKRRLNSQKVLNKIERYLYRVPR